ncbi:MAG: SH3 domain-containing protein [Chloroflexota bacterium]
MLYQHRSKHPWIAIEIGGETSREIGGGISGKDRERHEDNEHCVLRGANRVFAVDFFFSRHKTEHHPLLALFVLFILTLGCSATSLVNRPQPTAESTRPLVPTFTATMTVVREVVIITPPVNGTPGVIIVPPNVDPESVIPFTFTPTETPTPSQTPTSTSTPSPTPGATSTETQTGTVTGTATGTSTATSTVTPTETPTETPTPTPTLTSTPSLTPTPTPFVLVDGGVVSLRIGPGVEYPPIAQLGPSVPVAITGQTPDGAWFQLCCVNGSSVWIAAGNVIIGNDSSQAPLVVTGPAPSPTPTSPPTQTPTSTFTPTATPPPFQIWLGPEYSGTDNALLSIWIKLSVSTADGPPAEGYFLHAEFKANNSQEVFERYNTLGDVVSRNYYEWNRPVGARGRRQFNYKFEYRPATPTPEPVATFAATPTAILNPLQAIGDGTWTIWVVDGEGRQLSESISFVTNTGNRNREMWIHLIRTY